jgi:hypothetical protein
LTGKSSQEEFLNIVSRESIEDSNDITKTSFEFSQSLTCNDSRDDDLDINAYHSNKHNELGINATGESENPDVQNERFLSTRKQSSDSPELVRQQWVEEYEDRKDLMTRRIIYFTHSQVCSFRHNLYYLDYFDKCKALS